MELEVNSEAVAVETVEVVAAAGEDAGAAALMGQQLMVTNSQDLIVPSPEVRLWLDSVLALRVSYVPCSRPP